MWVIKEDAASNLKANPLIKINVRKNYGGALVGMQLVYSQGIQSPFFTVGSGYVTQESILVDQSKIIETVSMLTSSSQNSLKSPSIHYLDEPFEPSTQECCWKHLSVPLGRQIVGLRVGSDQIELNRIDFLLTGQEINFPSIDGFVEFGKPSTNWTFEWPKRTDLVRLDLQTVQ